MCVEVWGGGCLILNVLEFKPLNKGLFEEKLPIISMHFAKNAASNLFSNNNPAVEYVGSIRFMIERITVYNTTKITDNIK